MDSRAEQLEKKKKLEDAESTLPEIERADSKKAIFGEVQLKPAEETVLLEEIQRLKREAETREVKDVKKAGTGQDDHALAGVSAATSDDENSIEYYGYKIPKKAIQKITDEIKMKLNLSATWRAVLLTRLLQMS